MKLVSRLENSQYWPHSLENRAALRTAIATLVALYLAFILHLPIPFWTGITIVMTTNLYAGSVLPKTILRIIGTIGGAVVGCLCVLLIGDSIALFLLLPFIVITLCMYFYTQSDYGYAYLLASLCICLIVAQLAIDPSQAFFVALWRPIEIVIGVIVSALSAYFIFPNRMQDTLPPKIDTLFEEVSCMLSQLQEGLQQGNLASNSLHKKNLAFRKSITKALEALPILRLELVVPKEQVVKLRFILNYLLELSRQLNFLLLITKKVIPAPLDASDLFKALQQDLAAIHKIALHNEEELLTLASPQVLANFEKQIQHQVEDEQKEYWFALVHFFQHVDDHLMLLKTLLYQGQKDPLPSTIRPERLHFDKDRMKHSVKAGLSITLALVFWLMSGWSAGIYGIISSVFISIRNNLDDMIIISWHRLLGCLLGGSLFLAFVFFVPFNNYTFSMVLLCGIWGFSYLMFVSKQYTYIGLQASVALIMSLGQAGWPILVLDAPLQRLGGIVIGIVASFIVANLLWPTDILSVLQSNLNKIHHYQRYNLKQLWTTDHNSQKLYNLTPLIWSSRELLESCENKNYKPNKKAQVAALRQQFEALLAIQMIINHLTSSLDSAGRDQLASEVGEGYEQKLIAAFTTPCASEAWQLCEHMKKASMPGRGYKNKKAAEVFAYLQALYGLSYHFALWCSSKESEKA